MSIASEIQRLQGVRTNIFDAIPNKGVTVPSGAKLADCPDLISSISGGGGRTGGWPYAGFFDFGKNYRKALVIDTVNNCFYGYGNYSSSTDNSYSGGVPFFSRVDGWNQRTEDWEISIDFKLRPQYLSNGKSSGILLGTTDYYNSTGTASIDFNTNDKRIVLLLSCTTHWGDENACIIVYDERVTYDYMSSNIVNVKARHIKNTDDFEFEVFGDNITRKTLQNVTYGNSSAKLALGGIYDHVDSLSNALADIYFSSYFKVDGEFLNK